MARYFLTLLALLCTAAVAQDPDAVVITTQRDPVTKPYRKIVSGMDLFERKRAEMAPQAELRFKLLPRKRTTSMKDVDLEIAGKDTFIPVAIAPDGTFALPRDGKALAEDAAVVPNRKRQSMTWRAEIRSPGLPPGMRRLGDLRLECEVGMEARLISNRPSNLLGWFVERFADVPEYCHQDEPRYLFFAERPVWSVTLVSGSRRETLPAERLYAGATRDPGRKEEWLPYCDCEALLDRAYYMPLGDKSWPDDTLVQFEYMEDR